MIGIDFSMNSPAVVIGDSSNPENLEMLCFSQRKKDASLVKNIRILDLSTSSDDEQRYYSNAWNIIAFIKRKTKSKEVWIEDYSYGSTGSVFNIAEATGILKSMLWQEGFKINKVSPKAVKKFATKSGNAKKTDMYDSFLEKTGYDFNSKLEGHTKHLRTGYKDVPSPCSDLIDAYFILQYGLNDSSIKTSGQH